MFRCQLSPEIFHGICLYCTKWKFMNIFTIIQTAPGREISGGCLGGLRNALCGVCGRPRGSVAEVLDRPLRHLSHHLFRMLQFSLIFKKFLWSQSTSWQQTNHPNHKKRTDLLINARSPYLYQNLKPLWPLKSCVKVLQSTIYNLQSVGACTISWL